MTECCFNSPMADRLAIQRNNKIVVKIIGAEKIPSIDVNKIMKDAINEAAEKVRYKSKEGFALSCLMYKLTEGL